MYSSPAKRSRGLFTVGVYARSGRGLALWVAPEAWTDLYHVPPERVASIFGSERETADVTPTLAEGFVTKLDKVFEEIGKPS